MKNKKLIITLTTLCLAIAVSAQEQTIEKENQQWIQYYNQLKLGEKWTLATDGGYRWIEKLDESRNTLHVWELTTN